MMKNTKKSKTMRKLLRNMSALRSDNSGLALVEFAISLPFFIGLTVGGFEMANYATAVMKLNQITIHTADGAARMGQANGLAERQVTETDINDIFAGTIREGESLLLDGQHEFKVPGEEDVILRGNARIILSSIEPIADFDADDPDKALYRIRWQRCTGSGDFFKSTYGDVDTEPKSDGFGPNGRKIQPPEGGAVMLAEIHYFFRPLILNGFTTLTDREISKVASMVVRDTRDFTQIHNPDNVQISLCDGLAGGDDFIQDN